MIPPLLLAKIKVKICSCLASEEDIAAMNALQSLNGTLIEYYEISSENESKGGGMGRLVSGLFSTNSTSFGPSKGAELSICDSIGGPILKIDFEESDNDTGSETRKLPLKKIGGISPNDSFMSSASGICIYSKKKNENGESGELCRFNLKTLSGDDRDEVIAFMNTVKRWNEKRSIKANEDETDEDDDVQQKIGLGQTALKMKHFAEREIELSKQKRDRESRKARYLKDSGGLKYTAIAMANRSIS